MLVKEISLNKTSFQQITEYTVCEPETSEYTIDCYPYSLGCSNILYIKIREQGLTIVLAKN